MTPGRTIRYTPTTRGRITSSCPHHPASLAPTVITTPWSRPAVILELITISGRTLTGPNTGPVRADILTPTVPSPGKPLVINPAGWQPPAPLPQLLPRSPYSCSPRAACWSSLGVDAATTTTDRCGAGFADCSRLCSAVTTTSGGGGPMVGRAQTHGTLAEHADRRGGGRRPVDQWAARLR